MANRYKKHGAQGPVIEGEYRHSGSDEFFSRENRLRRKDATERRNQYENRRQGPPAPRPSRPTYRFEGPRPEDDLRKAGRYRNRIFAGINVLGRTSNPIIQAADLIGFPTDFVGDITSPVENPSGFLPEGFAGNMVLKCVANPFHASGANDYDKVGTFSGHNNGSSCGLSGQASPGVAGDMATYIHTGPSANRTWINFERRGVVNRRRYDAIWWEYGVSGKNNYGSFRKLDYTWRSEGIFTNTNPNIMRASPSPVSPALPRSPADAIKDRIASRTRTRGAVRTGGSGSPPGRTVPTKPGPPAPPKPGQKERKGKSTMRVLLGLLDAISEGAEVVDAIYEALPEKTKRKWDCSGGRGLVDSAGQYGIDKADCKLAALWHNWHKVDIEEAVRNIIANQLQDRVIGDLSRAQPVNVGRATEDAQKLVNDVLEWIFENSGLTA